jgi:hypothetical protein
MLMNYEDEKQGANTFFIDRYAASALLGELSFHLHHCINQLQVVISISVLPFPSGRGFSTASKEKKSC